MKENAIKEGICRYIPDRNTERDTGECIRLKKPDHPKLSTQSEKEGTSDTIADITIDTDLLYRLENLSMTGEIVSTTADLLNFS